MLNDFLIENNMICLNTKFHKREGQLWIHISPNNLKSQIDYLMINKKWKNSAKNCRSYYSFNDICSDHRIIIADIKLSLRANKKKITANKRYYCTLKQAEEIRRACTNTLINRFSILQSRDTENITSANTQYNHFEEVAMALK